MRIGDRHVSLFASCAVKAAAVPGFSADGVLAQRRELARDLQDARLALRAAQETLTREHAALVDYHGDHNEADCETCALIARIADAVTPPLHAQG